MVEVSLLPGVSHCRLPLCVHWLKIAVSALSSAAPDPARVQCVRILLPDFSISSLAARVLLPYFSSVIPKTNPGSNFAVAPGLVSFFECSNRRR